MQPHSQVDTENHDPITRGMAFVERKCRCSLSPTRYHDLQSTSKRPRIDDDMETDEIEINDSLYLSNKDKYGLLYACISKIGMMFSKLSSKV